MFGEPSTGGYRFSCTQTGDDPIGLYSWNPNALANSAKGSRVGGYIAGSADGKIVSINASDAATSTAIKFAGGNFVVWFTTMPKRLDFHTSKSTGHCVLGNFDGSPIGPCDYVASNP